MTTNQRAPILVGFVPPVAAGGIQSNNLNAANTQIALSFVLGDARTLSEVTVYTGAVGGTQGSISSTANLCADASGVPDSGTIIETATIAAGSWPASYSYATYTGFTTALTAGVRYWIVFKNTSETPATDYPNVRHGATSSSPSGIALTQTLWGWAKAGTTDGGTAWATSNMRDVYGLFLKFSDGGGSYAGLVSSGAAASTSYAVYADRESGALFTTPSNAKLVVRGIAMSVVKTGTPTGSVRFRLYEGTTLLGTTASIPTGNINGTTADWRAQYFSAAITLNAATAHRIVLGETTQSDGSSDAYLQGSYVIKDDANLRAIMPFGSWQRTYYNGSTWAETNTDAPHAALILDTDGPFASSGGASPVYGDLTGGL